VTVVRVAKGHGTQNDFVVISDLVGDLDLTPELVRALCDRHAGIGADGVLRVVRAENHPEAAGQPASFFMDYRNADGSIAEMCGNGVRVFARWLAREGLIGDRASIATRGGVKAVQLHSDGNISVGMGAPVFLDGAVRVTVERSSVRALPAVALTLPNPHVVVELASRSTLADLDLSEPPVVDPPLPAGQNVEFIVRTDPRGLAMRVHERGVGETRSCGTGICAAVVAAAAADGLSTGDGSRWAVQAPGGRCWVTWSADNEIELCGPAVLVADIDLSTQWLAAAVG